MSLTPNTNIAKKILTAVSGLLIFGFLTGHLLGNLLLFVGAEPFNIYAHQLTSNPLIYLAELILVIIFGSHIVTGIQVTLASRGARKKGYEVRNERTPKSWIVKSMPYTGTIIFLFIIFHIISFKFGPGFDESARINEGMLYLTMEGEPIRDLYKLVVVRFTNPAYSIFYVIAMISMGIHIAHAFQSAIRTLGVTNKTYYQLAQKASIALAVVFTVGFSSFPLYFMVSQPELAVIEEVETVESEVIEMNEVPASIEELDVK